MQQMPDVDLVRKFYALFKKGDRASCEQMCDEAIEWNVMEGMPAGGSRYVGRDAVFGRYFPTILASFAEFHAAADEFLGAGEGRVVVLGRYVIRSKVGRREFVAPFAHVYTVREGKIAAFRQYTDTVVIQKAAGPPRNP